jgi:HD-like signal output (HDOD) protein
LEVASGVTSAFIDVPNLDLKRFWQHSLTTTSTAKQLATELKMEADTAYIAGLRYNIDQLPIHMVVHKAG